MASHLQSKTMAGLLLILLTAVGLDVAGLLTDQAADVLKWVGAAFLSVRVAANMPNGGGK